MKYGGLNAAARHCVELGKLPSAQGSATRNLPRCSGGMPRATGSKRGSVPELHAP